MQREDLYDQLKDVLTISATEPTTYLEFVACLFDMEEEGVTPSCSKIIKRLWPEEWEQAADKIQFCATKWNLLRKRRHKINERVFNSSLLFSYFIQLTTDKEFRLLYDPHEIFVERLEELERSLVKTSQSDEKLKLEENMSTLRQSYEALKADCPQKMIHPLCSFRTVFATVVIGLFALLVISSGFWVANFLNTDSVTETAMTDNSEEKISIAVMPFTSTSKSGEAKDSFNQGLSDGIIAALSRFPQMLVISRNSVEFYRGQDIDVKVAGLELGAKYIVSGNTYASGDRIRVTARLDDVNTGRVLWSEQWEDKASDLFSLQNDLTLKILVALQVKLSEGEKALSFAQGTRSIRAYSKLMEGYYYFFQETFMDTLRARHLGEQAIAADPDYAAAYALLADSYLKDLEQNSDTGQLAKAYALIERGERSNPDDPVVQNVYSRVYWYGGEYEKALRAAERSLEIAPSFVEGLCWYGALLNWMGQHETAIRILEQSVRLDPKDHALSYIFMGWAYRDLGDYENAIRYLEKAFQGRPQNVDAYFHLAACYVAAGRISEGRRFIEKALSVDPTITIEKIFSKPSIGLNPGHTKQFIVWLKLAGLS